MEEMAAQDQQGPKARMDIATVLKKQNQAPCGEYATLLKVFTESSAETRILKKCLCQLRDCVTLLTRDHEHLVGFIFGIDWLNKDITFICEYKPFILNLVSAHPYYLRSCVRMLVKRFLPQAASKRTASGADKPPDQATRELYEGMFTHVHELMRALASIVPSTGQVVIQVTRDCFPYITRDVFSFETYTRNLLLVIQYIPDIRLQILNLVVEKMLQLDVRAPRNEIVEAEDSSDEEEEDGDDMFKMGGIVDDEGKKDSDNKEKLAKAAEDDFASQTMNHREAQRLDIMMDLMFNYIHSTCYPKVMLSYIYSSCYPKGEFDWEATKKLYRELLSVFDSLIFSTHASCHSQFLIFYIVSFRRELLVGFVDFLWKKVKAPMMQNVFRQVAVGYIGSLLARAAFIHNSTLTTTVKIMTDWLHDYLKETGSDVLHADVSHRGPFYAVCQAVFYAFSFRNQELLENDKGYRWADSLGFQRLVNCKLNPLRVCLPLVSSTFASITRMHQIALCDTVIQRNNRLKWLMSEETLDAYFPFDPYVLKRSNRWIKHLYREYQGNLPDIKKDRDGDIEEEEDEDDFVPDVDIVASLGAFPFSTSAGKMDFMKYSVSPGFKL
ncbi:hypothetical protein ACOMHN_009968 [Nucella lapillus]